MDITQIINIVAIIISPVFAVVIGQNLQDRAIRRKEQIELLQAFLTAAPHFVSPFMLLTNTERDEEKDDVVISAMSIIPIVFRNDKKIMEAYEEVQKCLADILDKYERSTLSYKEFGTYISRIHNLILRIGRKLYGYDFYIGLDFKVGSGFEVGAEKKIIMIDKMFKLKRKADKVSS